MASDPAGRPPAVPALPEQASGRDAPMGRPGASHPDDHLPTGRDTADQARTALEPTDLEPTDREPSGHDNRHHRRLRGDPTGRLDLGDAIHDGWQAYCRAPRVFTAYALLVNLLILLAQALLMPIGSFSNPSVNPRDWGLYLVGVGLMAGLFLWGSLGLGRGSLLALRGRRPTLALLLRWDGLAWQRLLRAWLRLAAMVGLPAGAALLLFGLPLLVLQQEQELQRLLGRDATTLLALSLAALLLLSLALSLVALLYLTVNQAFLLQIVLLEGCGGSTAVRHGLELVNPQWPLVLLMVLLMAILNGLGLLACGVGSLVAWPTVICISTAGYRQLRAADPRAGSGEAGPAEPNPAA